MPSTENYSKTDPGLFGLFIGESGAGKSTAALSFPNSYTLDFDKKMPTVGMKHFPGKRLDWDVFADVFQVSDKLSEWYNKGCPYETVIIDSITSLSTTCLNSVGKTKHEDVIKQMGTLTKSGTLELMGIDYYNAEANFFERYFLDMLRTLWAREGNPKHIILTAHVVKVDSAPDLKTKIITTTKSIVTAGRKVAAFIPTRFDEVYRFGWELPSLGDNLSRPKNICITSALGEDNAKTAFKFPERIEFSGKSLYDEMCKYTNWGNGK